MKTHDFERNGGETIVNGKSTWPDCLNIEIDYHEALDLIEKLIRCVNRSDSEYDSWCLPLIGKLDYDIAENADSDPT